jgi:hypothetical protein
MLLLGASLNSVHQILGRTTEAGQVHSEEGALGYFLPTEEKTLPPSEEKFTNLFKAARVLLRGSVAAELV